MTLSSEQQAAVRKIEEHTQQPVNLLSSGTFEDSDEVVYVAMQYGREDLGPKFFTFGIVVMSGSGSMQFYRCSVPIAMARRNTDQDLAGAAAWRISGKVLKTQIPRELRRKILVSKVFPAFEEPLSAR